MLELFQTHYFMGLKCSCLFYVHLKSNYFKYKPYIN